MAINCIQRIMIAVLNAVGYRIQDPWENGTAQEELTTEAKLDRLPPALRTYRGFTPGHDPTQTSMMDHVRCTMGKNQGTDTQGAAIAPSNAIPHRPTPSMIHLWSTGRKIPLLRLRSRTGRRRRKTGQPRRA